MAIVVSEPLDVKVFVKNDSTQVIERTEQLRIDQVSIYT